MTETVVFDLDGTLVDTLPDIETAANAALAAAGRRALTRQELRELIGSGGRVLMANAFRATGEPGSEARIDAAFAAYIAAYEVAPVAASALFPGVRAALEGLAGRGARLAVCTNKPGHLARIVLQTFGLAGFFAAVVAGDTLPVRKPRPEPLLEAVARAGGALRPAVMVGDSPIDADAARAARIPFIAVSFGYCPMPASALGADAVIDSFDALAGAIDGLSREARMAYLPQNPSRVKQKFSSEE